MNKKQLMAGLVALAGSFGIADELSIRVTSGKAAVAAEGGDTILVFSEDAQVLVNGSGTADVLAVGGGGGGGAKWGGGGGGGGVAYQQGVELSAGYYTITVGAGGLGATLQGADYKPTSGGDSSFADLVVARGGGAGGTYGAYTPPTGFGSGGGGGCWYPGTKGSVSGATGMEGQGCSGGASLIGSNAFWTQGGGGGGAGGSGGDAIQDSLMTGSRGGAGRLVPICGNKYYGGGGGGGGGSNAQSGSGAGGIGGGGNGGYGYSTCVRGADGEPGTGGGGGGGGGYNLVLSQSWGWNSRRSAA